MTGEFNNSDWNMTWNLKNRLSTIENDSTKIKFLYDYAGRRIRKSVYAKNGTEEELTKETLFLYNGFKMIEENITIYESGIQTASKTKHYVWNFEELLGFNITENGTSSETYIIANDGNKNCTDIMDSNRNQVAHYEYSPFGQTISSSGSLASENPFRFSNEYHNDETGLIYYNFRYYNSENGNWISRDPIEEQGGLNLYGMVENDPINYWDYQGNKKRQTVRNPSRKGNITKRIFGGGQVKVYNKIQLVGSPKGSPTANSTASAVAGAAEIAANIAIALFSGKTSDAMMDCLLAQYKPPLCGCCIIAKLGQLHYSGVSTRFEGTYKGEKCKDLKKSGFGGSNVELRDGRIPYKVMSYEYVDM